MDELQAGRELDALVAEKVMEWKGVGEAGFYTQYPAIALCGLPPGAESNIDLQIVPRYSTLMTAAWEVHCRACSWLFSKRRRYFAALQEQTRTEDGGLVAWPDVLVVLRDRMPEAICLAALEVKKDENCNMAHGLRG